MCYLYRSPAVTFEWYDSFVQMLDGVYKAKNHADVIILGDFNIDMLKPHSCWDSALALFGLAQLITSPTRTTPTSTSLIDNIYTNNPSAVVTTDVSDLSISDRNPISCTCTPFDNVHQHMDPNEALAVWYKLFTDLVNRHAPVRHKRVKHSKMPPWLNKDIIQAMSDRDRVKKERMFTEYKTARNKVKILVRNAYIYNQQRYQKTLLQCSHKTSHRLCISSEGWLWRSILKKQQLNSLH